MYALSNCPNRLHLLQKRKEQVAQHIDGRNAHEVPTKLWDKNGLH